MSDFDDIDLTDEEERRRAAIIRRARVEGIEAAYESALRVCKDVKAPAQAVSNASRTLLQIGGILDRADRQASMTSKEPHEMDGHELAHASAAAARRAKSRARLPTGDIRNLRVRAGNVFD